MTSTSMTGAGELRVVTLNLWGEQGPWPRRLELVGDNLLALGADIVALQEVRDVPGKVPNQAATLAARLGFHHVFAPATPWGGGDEGVALLSRWPLGEVRRLRLPHAVPRRAVALGRAHRMGHPTTGRTDRILRPFERRRAR